jgi:hypothetical protein
MVLPSRWMLCVTRFFAVGWSETCLSAAAWGFCIGFATAAPAGAATFVFGDLPLTVPDGFVVEQAAGPPLVERPVTCGFDEAGRLYVTESSGSNAPLSEQRKDPQHRVLRLEDSDGDGVFDRSRRHLRS